MNTYKTTHALAAALISLAAAGMATIAHADIKDYEFQRIEQIVKTGPESIITIRLFNKKTGKSVPDAVIFATRLDMAPDSMPDMTTKITAMPGGEPGTYRFKANVSMAGGWLLSLGAKVQGETGTVENKLVIRAEK